MPRRSAEALVTYPLATPAQHPLLAPPSGLSRAEAAVWRELVASVRADQFRPGDGPVLAAFCAASLLEREAARAMRDEGVIVGGKVSPWVKVHCDATKAVGMLASKLRVCPSARIDGKTAGRTAAGVRGTAAIDWDAHFRKGDQ